jgi:hypothetical protein
MEVTPSPRDPASDPANYAQASVALAVVSFCFNPGFFVSLCAIVGGVVGLFAMTLGRNRQSVRHRVAFILLSLLGTAMGAASAYVKLVSLVDR